MVVIPLLNRIAVCQKCWRGVMETLWLLLGERDHLAEQMPSRCMDMGSAGGVWTWGGHMASATWRQPHGVKRGNGDDEVGHEKSSAAWAGAVVAFVYYHPEFSPTSRTVFVGV